MRNNIGFMDWVLWFLLLLAGLVAPVVMLLKHLGLSEAAREWGGASITVYWVVLLGFVITLLNLGLEVLRPWLARRRDPGMAGYRPVSGLPLLGSLLLAAASWVCASDPIWGAVMLLSYLLDPLGWVALSRSVYKQLRK